MTENRRPTLITFLLDETGSMIDCKASTISGFNEYINSMKKEAGKIRFTLIKWDSERYDVVHDGVKMQDVGELNEDSYQPGALTPLYDTVVKGIRQAEKVLKGKKSDWASLFVIMTDGYENASREHDHKMAFNLIDEKTKEGWTFVYLGADQDAYAVARSIGVPMGNTLNYVSGQEKGVFASVSGSSSRHMSRGSGQSMTFFSEENTYGAAPEEEADQSDAVQSSTGNPSSGS